MPTLSATNQPCLKSIFCSYPLPSIDIFRKREAAEDDDEKNVSPYEGCLFRVKLILEGLEKMQVFVDELEG